MIYDYIVVGGGPGGLTLAWYLAKIGKKILILEREKSLGGCHRVRRVMDDRYFTEHGPRIYLNNYLTFANLLKELGTSFEEIFTPYKFQITGLTGNSIGILRPIEFFWLAVEFFHLMINPNYAKKTSMDEFMNRRNFSDKSKDFVDRLCRLTDGAGIHRYTLFEFLSLFNENAFYQVYQPKEPNDKKLFRIWEKQLLSTGLVTIQKDKLVLSMGKYHSNMYSNAISNNEKNPKPLYFVRTSNANNESIYLGEKIILAIPPVNISEILSSSNLLSKSKLKIFSQWSQYTNYIPYLSMTFHWNQSMENITEKWGFPTTEWAVAFIKMSDYMNFSSPDSKAVFSVAVTRNNSKSNYTGKTANESNEEEMIAETFRQLNQGFGGILPNPTKSILSPGVYKSGNKWKSKDTNFMLTPIGYINNEIIPDAIYNTGCQNGNSFYSFTAMEGAVDNAVALVHKLEPDTKKIVSIKRPWKVTDLIKIITLITLIIFIFFHKN